MHIIAITGGIASGKTTVANIFATKYAIPVIDSDHIARDLVQPDSVILDQIINKFGNQILNPDKSLNRKSLRQLIFNNQEYKLWLENLLHPEINRQIELKIKELRHKNLAKYCLVLIPLLTKEYLKKNNFIDKVLVINSLEKNQINRAISRDNQTTGQIKNIINTQLSVTQQINFADYIITNNSTLGDLEKEVDVLHKKLNKLASIDTNI